MTFCFGSKKNHLFLSDKNYWGMVPEKKQKTDNLCGFLAFYSIFLLFKLYQGNLNNFQDMHALNFRSNFILIISFFLKV